MGVVAKVIRLLLVTSRLDKPILPRSLVFLEKLDGGMAEAIVKFYRLLLRVEVAVS